MRRCQGFLFAYLKFIVQFFNPFVSFLYLSQLFLLNFLKTTILSNPTNCLLKNYQSICTQIMGVLGFEAR